MSVDNTGDTDFRTSIPNGTVTFRDTHSPKKSPTQLDQSQTDSESEPNWNCSSPISSPTPGTPRIIRRVDSISAVYAPDKAARAASKERLRVSSPASPNVEHVIYVQRSPPEPDVNNEVKNDDGGTKRHSIEFYTPSAAMVSEEDMMDDYFSNDDSTVEVSPHRMLNSSSFPEHTSHAMPDDSIHHTPLDTQDCPALTPVAVGSHFTDITSEPLEKQKKEIQKPVAPLIPLKPSNEGTESGLTDHDSMSSETLTKQQNILSNVSAANDPISTNIEQNNRPEPVDSSGDTSDPSKCCSVTVTNHTLKLGDSPGSAFRSVLRRSTTPPTPVENASNVIQSASYAACELLDSKLSDNLVSKTVSDKTFDLEIPIESATATFSSLSTAPLLIPAEQLEGNSGTEHHISYDHPQPASSVQAKETAAPNSQSRPLEPALSEIIPQIVEHVHSNPELNADQTISTPNLALITDHVNSPDAELQAMLSPSVLTARSDPATDLRLSCYSPAELVKVTGGASVEIMRNIEGEDEVGQPVGDQPVGKMVNAGVELEPPLRTPTLLSRPTRTGTMFDRRRMSAPDTDVGISTSAVPVINIQVKVDAQLKPSTPEEVDASSKMIFGNFIAERYNLEVNASAKVFANGSTSSASASASADSKMASTSQVNVSVTAVHRPAQDDIFGTDFASIPRPSPNSMEAAVARNLAQIGDEISRQYGRQLDRMIKLLPGDECPVDVFTNVARALFSRGPTNWGQIVTLFYFGYRLVVRRVRSGVVNAFSQVCQCLISFCRQLNIFAWIAQRGGWLILKYLRLSGTSETIPDEEISDVQNRSTGTSSGSTLESTTRDVPDTPVSTNPLLGTFLVISSGIAIACVAVFIYRRLNSS